MKVATMSSAFDQNIDLPLAKSEEEQAGGDIVINVELMNQGSGWRGSVGIRV